MDERVVAIARTQAARAWRTARYTHPTAYDLDDLRQVALLGAWEWLQAHPERESDLDDATPLLHAVCARRIVDELRSIGNRRRRGREGEWHQQPRSLDELARTTHLDLRAMADTQAQDDLEAVERAHDLAQAFRDHSGSSRHAAVAWLALHGFSLADIGAHYGVTESRASQMRTTFIYDVQREWGAA